MPLASAGNVGRSLSQPAGSSRCMHLIELLGQFRDTSPCIVELLVPGVAQLLAALADALLGNVRGRRPAPGTSRPPASRKNCLVSRDFFFAQRFAVGGAGVLLVRRAVADVAVDDDQRRPVVVFWNVLKARASISRSLASPTESRSSRSP